MPGIYAANMVDIGITCGKSNDTLCVADPAGNPIPSTFDIYIENDIGLGGMSLGFQIWAQDGTSWEWLSVLGGWGPLGVGTGLSCVTVVPGSRLDPPDSAFDMTKLLVTEKNMDELLRDTIQIGGVSLFEELEPGPLEHMVSFHFLPKLDQYYYQGQLCIDSCFVVPGGAFVFSDAGGQTFPPLTAWEYGSKCWPVAFLGCQTVSGEFEIDPEPFYAQSVCSGEPKFLTIHAGNFSCGYQAEQFSLSTLRVLHIIPDSIKVIDSYPGYDGKVLEILLDMKNFIEWYPLWWDTALKYVSIYGSFGDGAWFEMIGHVPGIGHTAGDANGDGITNVGDVVCIMHYLFREGPEPCIWQTADVNASGDVNIDDAVSLINYIFREGDSPDHP